MKKFAFLAILSCLSFPVYGVRVQEIITDKDSMTLFWSPPAWPSTYTYNIYFRKHGDPDTSWKNLATGLTDTTLVIQVNQIGLGSFDFAVDVSYLGDKSAKHTSLDSNAFPAGGWYLTWEKTVGKLTDEIVKTKIKKPPLTYAYLPNGRRVYMNNNKPLAGGIYFLPGKKILNRRKF